MGHFKEQHAFGECFVSTFGELEKKFNDIHIVNLINCPEDIIITEHTYFVAEYFDVEVARWTNTFLVDLQEQRTTVNKSVKQYRD